MATGSAPPEVIGSRYALGAQLGAGGMGTVYRATDRLTGQTVALKRVRVAPALLAFNTRGSIPDAALCLAREFQTLASLRHPHIISVLDYGFDAAGQPYFTMTLLEEAADLLGVARQRDTAGQVDLLVQVLEALAYLHRRGIVHRDLKPDNVLVGTDGQARVLDFGLALEPAQAREIAGTLAYMAPEVLRGEGVTPAADLYAVGVMAFEMFTGRYPFSGSDLDSLIRAILSAEPDLSDLPATAPLPPTAGTDTVVLPADHAFSAPAADAAPPEMAGHGPLAAVVARLLDKDPARRYPDAYAAMTALCAAVGRPAPREDRAVRESYIQAARFVGREAELNDLLAAFERARSGQGSAWLVGGESGVGKSRLLEELRVRALVRGATALHGQGVQGGGLLYQLWREPLRRLALATPLTNLEAGVLQEIVPDLGALLGRAIPPPPPADAALQQQRLAHTIADLFARQPGPVVLLLEDLQWTVESLEPLRALVHRARDLPLLIVADYRDDEAPDLSERLPGMTALRLARLSPASIADLSYAMLGETGRQRDVLDLLGRETEGNAFFLVETVRALAEEAGRLADVGRRTLPASVFAGGVRRVVERRLARVPDDARPLLDFAAICGRQIDSAVMRAAGVEAAALESWLAACADAAVLDIYAGGWRFTHDKLREHLLDALSPALRAPLHRRAALAVEAAYAADLDAYAAVLAEHWMQAGDERQAGRWALVAAKQAQDTSAPREARALYLQALACRAHEQADNPAKALADLYIELGRASYGLSDYDDARRWQSEARAAYAALDDRLGLGDAVGLLAEIHMRQGDEARAEALAQESLALYRAVGARVKEGYALMNLGVIAAQRGDSEQARDLFLACHDILRADGRPVDQARALNNLGAIHDLLGDHDRAAAYLNESLALRRQIDDRRGIAYCLVNLGAIAMVRGQHDEARQLVDESLVTLRQIGEQQAVGTALGMLGEIALKAGDRAEARRRVADSLAVRREIGDRGGTAWALRVLGDLEAGDGYPTAAWTLYREALAIERERGVAPRLRDLLESFAQLLAERGQDADALALYALLRRDLDSEPERAAGLDARIAALEARLLPDAAAAARARASAWTLDAAAASLLDTDAAAAT